MASPVANIYIRINASASLLTEKVAFLEEPLGNMNLTSAAMII